jgi:hypothetical protein
VTPAGLITGRPRASSGGRRLRAGPQPGCQGQGDRHGRGGQHGHGHRRRGLLRDRAGQGGYLKILLDAGLLWRRRAGRSVLFYYRTAVGDRLVRAQR